MSEHPLRVVVFTGTRLVLTVKEAKQVCAAVDSVPSGVMIFVGDSTGVDEQVRRLVPESKRRVFDANWAKHGPSAGPMRNREMLTEALKFAGDRAGVRVYAFPSPLSKGTWDCVQQASRMRIRSRVFPL